MKKKNYKQTKKNNEKFDVKIEAQKEKDSIAVKEARIEMETSNENEAQKGKQTPEQIHKLYGAIVLASILGMVISGFMFGFDFIKLVKNCLLIAVFDFVILSYVQLNKDLVNFPTYSWWLLGGSYLVSILLLCNPYEVSNYPFWLIGIVMIATYINVNMSLLICYGLILIGFIVAPFDMNIIVMHVLLGSFLCLFVRHLNKISQLFYSIVLISSMNITLSFLMNDFEMESVLNQTLGFMILADGFIIGTVYLVKLIAPSKQDANNIKPIKDLMNPVPLNKAIPEMIEPMTVAIESSTDSVGSMTVATLEAVDLKEIDEDIMTSTKSSMLTDMEELKIALLSAVGQDAKLLLQMKMESDKLYHHSKMIADISKRAALFLGANEELAYAGGWYHEIGRLTGKDYIENGVTLIRENQLPNEIAEIIIQHNFKQQLPQTMEAAIVMLTDNIVSTIQYVKNRLDQQVAPEKVIENTFLVRMNKGILNETKITLHEFMKLKEFYLSIVDELR